MTIERFQIVHYIYDTVFKKYIFRTDAMITIPKKFQQLIEKKAEKWNRESGKTYQFIPFTIGFDSGYGIWAISIVHPDDILKSTIKIAEDILIGRIKRELGTIIGRLPYSERTILSEQCAYNADDEKLIIPFPDFIISPEYVEKLL